MRDVNPNELALLVFWTWPLIAILLFRRFPPATAIASALVYGYLFVPSRIRYDLPLMPAIDREMMPAIAAMLLALMTVSATRAKGETPCVRPGLIPTNPLVVFCMALIVFGPIGTVLTNGDTLRIGPVILPPLRFYDAGAAVLTALTTLIPFFLARKYIAHPDDHRRLLFVIAIAALVYSLPTLWEARMSPQINVQLYGYFPSSWIQHLRSGGFRPVVFLEHGLRLGIFLALSLAAAATCWRLQPKRRTIWLAACGWLAVTLFFAKTYGAFLIGMSILPIALFSTIRLQLLTAAMIAAITITYPVTRTLDLLPTERIVSMVPDPQRRASLSYRFMNEDVALKKSAERPIFGWGGWGRQRVYNDEGVELTEALDGRWIIIFGEGGWTRYIGQFGLLTLPLFVLFFRRRAYDISLATAGLALALAVNVIDLLPNSSMTILSWLMAGAIVGRLEIKTVEEPDEFSTAEAGVTQDSPYRRTFGEPVTLSRMAPDTPRAERSGRTPVRSVGRIRRTGPNET